VILLKIFLCFLFPSKFHWLPGGFACGFHDRTLSSPKSGHNKTIKKKSHASQYHTWPPETLAPNNTLDWIAPPGQSRSVNHPGYHEQHAAISRSPESLTALRTSHGGYGADDRLGFSTREAVDDSWGSRRTWLRHQQRVRDFAPACFNATVIGYFFHMSEQAALPEPILGLLTQHVHTTFAWGTPSDLGQESTLL